MGLSSNKASVNAARLLRDIERLATFGALPEGGIDRPVYSASYRDAINWLATTMDEAGLRVRQDEAGNLIGRVGPPGPAVLCGSHIDTVRGGGAYDGALGVLAAVECARALSAMESPMTKAFEVVAFADEEGAYLSLLGSRAMAGDLRPDELRNAANGNGERLEDALRRYGLDPAQVMNAARPASDFAGYVELHIEQGPVLEAGGHVIGIVESIAGIHKCEITFQGMANHAGTTPLHLRRDAFRCCAEFVTEMYKLFQSGYSDSMRLTYGTVTLEPNVSNVVPANVVLSQEIRGSSLSEMTRLAGQAWEVACAVGARSQVFVRRREVSIDPPAEMSPAAVDRGRAACEQLGLPVHRMLSGAGHDAQMFASRCDTGMIFVPSRGGISHQMREQTSSSDIKSGLMVLHRVLEGWLYR